MCSTSLPFYGRYTIREIVIAVIYAKKMRAICAEICWRIIIRRVVDSTWMAVRENFEWEVIDYLVVIAI